MGILLNQDKSWQDFSLFESEALAAAMCCALLESLLPYLPRRLFQKKHNELKKGFLAEEEKTKS
jgi:hypothetical protein